MKTLKFSLGWVLTLGFILFLVGCLPDSTTKWYKDSDSDSGVEPTETAAPTETATQTATASTDDDNVTSNKFPRFLSYTNRFLIPVESAAGFTYGSYVSSDKGSDGKSSTASSGSTSGSSTASGGSDATSSTCSGSTGTSFRGRVEQVFSELKDGAFLPQSYLLVRVECGTLGKGISVLDNHYNFIAPVTTTVAWDSVLYDGDIDDFPNDVSKGLLSTPLSYYRPLPVNLILTYAGDDPEHYPNIAQGLVRNNFGKDGKDIVRYISEKTAADVEHLFKEMVVHKVLKETDPENVEKFKLHYFGFVSAEQLNDGKDKNYPCADITDDNYQCLRPINPQHDNIMNSEDLNFIQDADSDVLALNSATIQLVAGEGDYADPFYMPGDDVTTPHNEAVGVINKKENDEAIFVTVEPGKVFVGAAGMETMNINPYGIPGVDDIEDGDGAEGTNPHHDDMIHKKVALAKVINNRFFPLYVGEQFVIEPVLGQWAEADKVTYALAPRFNGESNSNDLTTLPDGIQLDPKTGMLYGSPTKPLDRTFITIKATYTDTKKDSEGNTLTYSSYYTFEIRVYNVMEVVLDLDSSDALKNVTSYYFHKEGAGNTLRKCRITEDQIESDVHPQRIKDRHTNFRNIMCYLEGEEHDINSLGYKLNIAIGPGLCNYYGYFPFYDLQWKPQQTNSTPYFIKVNSYGDNEVCTPNVAGVSVHGQYCYPEPTAANRVPEGYYFNAGKIPEYKGGAEPCWIRKAGLDSLPPVQCHGNYASYHDIALLGVTGPSCDSGSYKYKEITVSEVELEGGGKACTMGSDPYSTVSCAGNYQNCYNTSLLPGGDGSEFVTGEIIAAARGNIGSSGSSSSGGSSSSSSSGSGGKTLVEAKNTKIVYDRMRRRANFVGSNSCVHVGGQYTYDSPIRPNHFIYFREGWRKYFNDECTEGGGDNTCLTDPLRYGNPFNTLQCLNAAYEVMANIDVVVREWDRHFTPDYHLDYLDPDVKEAKAVLHLEPDDQTYLDPEFSDNVNHWASLKNNDWRLYNSHNNDVWSQPFNDYLTWDNTIYDDNLIPAGLFQEADKTPLYESCNYKILREEDGSIKRDANGDIKEETVTSPQVFPVQLDKRNLGYCSTGFCTGYAGDKCEALSDDVTINEYTCRLYTALGVEDAGDVNGYFTFRGWSAPQVPGEARSYYDFMACRDGKPNDKGDGELEACPGAGFTRPNNYPELP